MDKWQIYFWEPSVSPHKIDLYRALASSEAVEETWYIAQEELSVARRKQGWDVNCDSLKNIVVGPTKSEISKIMASSSPRSIHLFSGMRRVPCIVEGIRAAILEHRNFGIMHEPRVFEGLRGWARFAHSWLTERALREHAHFILAIGRHGPSWFESVGYKRSRIFPFAYFLPFLKSDNYRTSSLEDQFAVRIGYLGRLERAKGVNLFLSALEKLSTEFEVHVAGGGHEVESVRRVVENSDILLNYRGAIPMSAVPAFLSGIDILVAPSITKDDGWGAVVSEALMVGSAVVATEHVGASVCLDDDTRGRVVPELTAQALADAIEWLVENGRLTTHYRALRSAWGNDHLSGDAGAAYLLAILNHVYFAAERPAPFFGGLSEILCAGPV